MNSAELRLSGHRHTCSAPRIRCNGVTRGVAHIGTYALAERVDEGAHIAGYALPLVVLSGPLVHLLAEYGDKSSADR